MLGTLHYLWSSLNFAETSLYFSAAEDDSAELNGCIKLLKQGHDLSSESKAWDAKLYTPSTLGTHNIEPKKS